MAVDLLDADQVSGEDLAAVHLAAFEADAATVGDGDSLVMEKIELRQPPAGLNPHGRISRRKGSLRQH
jgi:hypothetical protein